MAFDYKPFDYVSPPGLRTKEPRHPAVIVGAGPIGLASALELANHGVPSVVLDDNNVVSVGSRAICWSKRSLEILDRIGIGEACVAKGVTWKVGRTHHRAQEIFNFDLLPEAGHKMPAFINLQQYHVEQMLVERCIESPFVELRFKNKVVAIEQCDTEATITIETPEGSYSLSAEYLLACDGARSPLRAMMALDFEGELFEERFLIADIEMEGEFPSERWFWFEPDFHNGQSALLHKQPDNIYRIDLQLGWDADPEKESDPKRIIPRIEKVIGHSDFKLDWTSIYTFQCRRLSRFVHDRVIFVGDSAHIVSPFGARGGNGGLQDVDAIGWRLAAVLEGRAPNTVLEQYNAERTFGADENLMNSSRATRFMSPSAGAERWFRDATLALAAHADFARPMVNSGRLSVPCVYPLTAPDVSSMPPHTRPGAAAIDAPLKDGWLLNRLGGQMRVLVIGRQAPEGITLPVLTVEPTPEISQRYLGDAAFGIYLIRPDQIVAARWQDVDAKAIEEQANAIWEGRA
jgi:3-(3-hydroxy-phenyl)propionate hydroxylase